MHKVSRQGHDLEYIMDQLSLARLVSIYDLDYASPFSIHEKTHKEYSESFVCVTRIIHLELARVSLFIKAFLNCLRRFIARKGL